MVFFKNILFKKKLLWLLFGLLFIPTFGHIQTLDKVTYGEVNFKILVTVSDIVVVTLMSIQFT